MIKIHSYPESVVETKTSQNKVVVYTNETITPTYSPAKVTTVRIFEPGKPGPQGKKGDRGFDGTSRPFFQASDSPLVFATTASLQLYDLSSSLLPFTSSTYNTSFNIGAQTRPWKRIYTTHEGIFFVNANTGGYTTLYGGDGYIGIGKSRLTSTGAEITGSVKIQSSGSKDILGMYSGSAVRLRINKDGILIFSELTQTPNPINGAIIFSGSNFFFGV